MPASNAGVAEVEKRIRTVRHRLNALHLQNALYLAATVAALGAALIVAAALRGRAMVFGITLWSALAAIAAAAAYAGLHIRAGWLTVAQTARLADRRAELEDRLATLLARRDGEPSRLDPMLVDQVLAAAPRWDADVLAPRRAPRSLFGLAAALATLIATAFYARPPHPPAAPARAANAPATLPDPAPLFQRQAAPSDPPQRAPAPAGGRGTGEAIRHAADGSGPRTAESGDDPNAAAAARAPGTGAAPGLNERLRDAVRDALGGAPPDDRLAGRSRKPGREAEDAASQHDGEGARDAMSAPPRPRGTGVHDRPASMAPESQQAQAAALSRAGESGRGGRPAGGGGGATANELFTRGSVARELGQAPSLAIKISALRVAAASRSEPQRQPRPPGAAGEAAGAPAAADAPLVDESLPRAPLRKAEVAAEYEAIVRRIFARHE